MRGYKQCDRGHFYENSFSECNYCEKNDLESQMNIPSDPDWDPKNPIWNPCPTEEIISKDGVKAFHLFELMEIYKELGLPRFPEKNLHSRNWSESMYQAVPQVQDPIISFSSKSLILGLNDKQICKIRLDDFTEVEIKNHEIAQTKMDLLPRLDGIFEFNDGKKGLIMERLKVISKLNYTSGELNRIYYKFFDSIQEMHNQNILHNDLNKAIDSNERPNIVISENRLRLIDCEKMITDKNHVDWDKFYDKELKNINEYFSELVDFKCNTLT
jgi:hypothetical protein